MYIIFKIEKMLNPTNFLNSSYPWHKSLIWTESNDYSRVPNKRTLLLFFFQIFFHPIRTYSGLYVYLLYEKSSYLYVYSGLYYYSFCFWTLHNIVIIEKKLQKLSTTVELLNLMSLGLKCLANMHL